MAPLCLLSGLGATVTQPEGAIGDQRTPAHIPSAARCPARPAGLGLQPWGTGTRQARPPRGAVGRSAASPDPMPCAQAVPSPPPAAPTGQGRGGAGRGGRRGSGTRAGGAAGAQWAEAAAGSGRGLGGHRWLRCQDRPHAALTLPDTALGNNARSQEASYRAASVTPARAASRLRPCAPGLALALPSPPSPRQPEGSRLSSCCPDPVSRAPEEVRVPGNAPAARPCPRTKPSGPGGGSSPPAGRHGPQEGGSTRTQLQARLQCPGLQGQRQGQDRALERSPAASSGPPPYCPLRNRTVPPVTAELKSRQEPQAPTARLGRHAHSQPEHATRADRASEAWTAPGPCWPDRGRGPGPSTGPQAHRKRTDCPGAM